MDPRSSLNKNAANVLRGFREGREFEISTGKKFAISRSTAHRVVQALKNISPNTAEYQKETTYDVSSSSSNANASSRVRMTLDSSKATNVILAAIPNESKLIIKVERKANVQTSNESELMKVNLRDEEQLAGDEKSQAINSIKQAEELLVRLKLRESFTFASYRIDVTMVRTKKISKKDPLTFFKVEPTFEIELEYLGQDASSATAEMLVDAFLEKVLKIVAPVEYSHLQYPEVLSELLELSKTKAMGPKPVTLERRSASNLQRGYSGTYTVTDKADGERMFLFVPSKGDGNVYLVNDRLCIFLLDDVRAKESARGSILDGEYLESERRFLVFDLYFMNGEDKRGLSLLVPSAPAPQSPRKRAITDTRLTLASSVVSDLVIKEEGKMEIIVKAFRAFNDKESFHQSCKAVLDDRKSYHVDGLIFTPNDIPPPNGGTWPNTFKWKEPHQNSIDFMALLEPREHNQQVVANSNGSAGACITASLMVKANRFEKDGPITSLDYLTGNAKTRWSNGGDSVVDHHYLEAKIDLDCIGNGKVYSLSSGMVPGGDVRINNRDIVECSYDVARKKWVPMRVRGDKIRPNFMTTADNVMNSIKNPITAAMLKGLNGGVPEPGSGDDDAYYTHSNREIMSQLRRLHNGIKSHLIEATGNMLPSQPKYIVDFGIGRGGDLGKYANMSSQQGSKVYLFGIDPSVTNLSSPLRDVASVHHRLLSSPHIATKLKCVLLPMDASTDMTSLSVIDAIASEDDRNVARLVFGKPLHPHPNIPQSVKDDYSMFAAGSRFNVASCMFAVHYMFETEEKLWQFARNVDHFLSDSQGFFIGACLDGGAVRKLLEGSGSARHVEYRDEVGQMLWSITQVYGDDEKPGVGCAVDVYVATIGQTFREYLVDYEVLAAAMQSHGKLPGKASGMFGHLMDTAFEDHATIAEREYSKLHRWFAFSRQADRVPALDKRI